MPSSSSRVSIHITSAVAFAKDLYSALLDKSPRQNLLPWLVLHFFYGVLDSQCDKTIGLTSGKAFMKYDIIKAWGLLDNMKFHNETWRLDKGDN